MYHKRMNRREKIQWAAKRQLGVYPESRRYIRAAGIKKFPLVNEHGNFDCPRCERFVGWEIEDVLRDFGVGTPWPLLGICRHCDFEFFVTPYDRQKAHLVRIRHVLAENSDYINHPDDEWEDDEEEGDDFDNLL